jgi:hypothetical protein
MSTEGMIRLLTSRPALVASTLIAAGVGRADDALEREVVVNRGAAVERQHDRGDAERDENGAGDKPSNLQ